MTITQNGGRGFPTGIAVRTATPSDEAAVGALLRASYPVLMSTDYDPATLSSVLPLMTQANPVLLNSGSYFLAAAGDGRLVGCGGWSRENPCMGPRRPASGHIRHFATHPEFTRLGVGRAIHEKCVDTARAAGLRHFECCASLNAERFYAALGFKPVRRMMIPMGPWAELPVVLMEQAI